MNRRLLKVAVVGHTNTGKTSLLRTLTRDPGFGEVSSRPATTRHVEASILLVDNSPALELFDTPGLEDSSGLLDHLDTIRRAQGSDWSDAILAFLDEPDRQAGFSQEAKALRQVIASDVALYVIDARDRVLAKHRDELEILGRCMRPVLPVLNFVADPDAKPDLWREHLARVNMHAVVSFDTVVFDELGELRLYEKMRTLLDRFADILDAIIAAATERRAELRRASAYLIADLLIDAAACAFVIPRDDEARATEASETLKQSVREREQLCVDALLELHQFRPGDYLSDTLPIAEGQWGSDLFSPDALVDFGITTGGAAATGALAGLAVDAMVGGMTLGAAAATGAAVGALVGAARSRGRQVIDSLRGYTELQVDTATLDLLALRQTALVRALLRRGHASQDRVRLAERDRVEDRAELAKQLRRALLEARSHPDWSRLNFESADVTTGGRTIIQDRLATVLGEVLTT